MIKRSGLFLCIFLALNLIFTAIGSSPILASNEKLGMGLLEPTPVQVEWLKNNVPVIQKIRLNEVAFQRINSERQARGLKQLNKADLDITPIGNETLFNLPVSDNQLESSTDTVLINLPGSVDNSTSPAFPPIRSQGSLGSCAAWASTYYQMTYETNLALGRTASGGNNNVIFSPKWSYNMVNGGTDSGSSFASIFSLEMQNGAASWSEFPYDSNYRTWLLNPAGWSNAINYRIQSWGQISNSNTDILIDQTKTTLANGHIIIIATYVLSWDQKTVGNDPSTSLDDSFSGQKIASYATNTNTGGHGMTIVGYNDNIWCDLNSNGTVDYGEKGAFKIANSWGTSDWNGGYRWVTYDSLRVASAVSPSGTWPTTNRSNSGIFWNGAMYTLTVNAGYTPTFKAELTLNHSQRSEMTIKLGIGNTTSSIPSSTWTSKAINNSGGKYAFDGTTTTVDGTFYFDFTDLAKSVTGTKRWFVGITDYAAGSPATIKSFKLYKGDVLVASSTAVPKSIDASTSYLWIDYTLDTMNQAPTAVSSASTNGGMIPLSVAFNGATSWDPDGQIVSYAWNFGDGSTASGVSVPHIYTTAGTYPATLTVTDDKGATASSSIIINASPATNQIPIATITVSTTAGTIPLTVTFNGSLSRDPDGQIVSYTWNFGDGRAATGATANHIYTKAGNYAATLTVTDNKGAAASRSMLIIASTPTNQTPIATIVQSTTSGIVPLTVSFDGSLSRDPDGQIVSYTWNFGDGSTASGFSAIHIYTSAGTYTATLTVIDDKGATASSSTVINASLSINHAPVLNSIGSKIINAQAALQFTVTATDQDGDPLSFSADNLPSGANFNSDTRVFTWVPTVSQAGIFSNVHFQVSDSKLLDSEDVTITVNPVTPVTGQISGIIKDKLTASVIAGATISDGTHTIVTGTDGSFLISNISTGNYVLTASAVDYQTSSLSVSVLANQITVANFSLQKIPATTTMWVENIKFTPNGRYMDIAVRVVNPQPVSGARLTLKVQYGGRSITTSTSTNVDGIANIHLSAFWSGTWISTVTQLTSNAYTWDSTKGIRSSTYAYSSAP